MIKVIKFAFWTCVFAGLALVVRVTTTVKNNDIVREIINCVDGQCYEVSTSLDESIAEGVQNVLKYNPDAVVTAETRYYENGDIMKWSTDGEKMYFTYVWHAPLLGRVTWHWTTTGTGGEVPLREL